RVIIIGIRNDIDHQYTFPLPTHTSPTKKNHLGLKHWISISEALKDIKDPEEDTRSLKNHIYSQYKVTNRNFTGHRQTDPNKPDTRNVARSNGKGGVCALYDPNNYRRMSFRESALIHTFTIDFEFFESMTFCYRYVGNAVPVLFAETIARGL